MTILKRIAGVLMALLLFASAYGHLFTPEISDGFIPDFLPKQLVHILTSIVEFALGLGVFIPSTRKRALQGILILMVLFLPLHVMDLFRETPIIGSKNAAMIRLPFQFLFIFLAWFAGGRWGRGVSENS